MAVHNVTVGLSAVNPFNGSFLVTAVGDLNNPDPKILYYKTKTDPGNPDSSQNIAFIGVQFQATGNDAGTAAVVEGNRIFNCRVGGPYHDTYNTRDLIVRNNHYRAVAVGPAQSLGYTSAALGIIRYHNTNPSISYDRIKRTGDGKTALFTTQYTHGFEVGQGVKILEARVNGLLNNPYNGYFAVDSVPASIQFTYRMLNDPQQDADSTPVPQYERLWQTGSIVIENNLIELIGSINANGAPVAIILAKYVGDPSLGSQRLYKRVVIRNNVIRRVENATDAPNAAPSAGIQILYCEDALVENNVIDLETSTPIIQHAVCDQVRYFNNTNSAGALIQGADVGQAGNPKQSELTTAVEDANLLAF